MDKKKELREQYKQRVVIGGVYRLVNKANGRYLLMADDDIRGAKNRFDFSVMTDTCFHIQLKGDWNGGGGFAFEVLEEQEQKPEQDRKEFKKELEVLRELWSEKFEQSLSY